MRIAILTSRFPYPLERGDKLRIYHQIRHLSQEHEIYLFSVTDTIPSESDIARLKQFCKRVEFWQIDNLSFAYNALKKFNSGLPLQCGGIYEPLFHDRIKAEMIYCRIDVVYCQLIRMAPYLEGLERPVVIDYMDALGVGMKRRASVSPWYSKLLYKLEAKRVEKFEGQLSEKYDALTIISDQDKKLIPNKQDSFIHVVPNGIDAEYFQPQRVVPRYDVIFVGNLGYLPNIEAAEILAYKVVPAYNKKYNKKLNVLIAGARPSDRVMKLKSEQIFISPWREDIRTAYADGKLLCAPLFNGTGQQNKILEAMSMEIPCVSTSYVNKAIMAQNGTEILMANSIEEMIQAIHLLLEDEDIYDQIRNNSRKFVINNYTWQKSVSKLNSIFAQVYKQSV